MMGMEATLTKKSLKPKQKKFVEKFIENDGNATQAVKEVYRIADDNYAGVKGHRLLSNDKIVNAIEDALPDDLLGERHLELLNKREIVLVSYKNGEKVSELVDQPDTQAVSKALDMAYKLKGSYAPEKSVNLNIEVPVGKQKTATDAITRFLNGNTRDITK